MARIVDSSGSAQFPSCTVFRSEDLQRGLVNDGRLAIRKLFA